MGQGQLHIPDRFNYTRTKNGLQFSASSQEDMDAIDRWAIRFGFKSDGWFPSEDEDDPEWKASFTKMSRTVEASVSPSFKN